MGWMRTAGGIAIAFQLGCGTSGNATGETADTGASSPDTASGTTESGGGSSSGSSSGGAGSDGAIDLGGDGGATALDAGASALGDASTVGDASVLCADASCSATQLCAYQSGGPVQCKPLNDAGGCTAPMMYMSSCISLGNQPGCYIDTPPRPVRCLEVPRSCQTSPTCSCLSPDPCSSVCGGGSQCLQVQNGGLYCGCP
jgi:hypothetical protein